MEIFIKIIAVLCGIVLFVFLYVWLFQVLWNWAMPWLFNLPTLTWLQAWGVSVLSGMLFKPTYIRTNK